MSCGIHRVRRSPEAGFSLVDVLVAMAIMATGVAAMAQLFVLAAHGMASGRVATFATVLAAQKLEEMRSVAYTVDSAGALVTHSALTESPPGALLENTHGFVDHLDAAGYVVGMDVAAPTAGVYVRRWSIEALAAPVESLLVQVVVSRNGRQPPDAWVATVRIRSVR